MESRSAISLISKIRAKANRRIEQEMSARGIEGIATSHGDILYALFHTPKLTMAEIAQKIGRDKSTVTALVDKLVKLGYVTKERSPEDSRVIHVTLTSKGTELMPVFEEISQEIIKIFYQNITEAEKEQLVKTLEKVYNGL